MTLPVAGGLAAGVVAGSVALVHQATYGVRNQWLGPTVWHGRPDSRGVALTFDDGPSEDTGALLDTLAAAGARATFFMVGRQVERFPDLARRVVADGHAVGNHSYSHPIYLYATPSRTRRELTRAQEVIADVVGVRPAWSRPPAGVRTPAYFRVCRDLGLRTIQWSACGFDWNGRRAHSIAHRVERDLENGAIVLLHDATHHGGPKGRAETVKALPKVIAAIDARALRIAPLQTLLTDESIHASNGLS
jgi:peptidoglycan/xylan/chitin deacetylase (PgdA/CDA1 family)